MELILCSTILLVCLSFVSTSQPLSPYEYIKTSSPQRYTNYYTSSAESSKVMAKESAKPEYRQQYLNDYYTNAPKESYASVSPSYSTSSPTKSSTDLTNSEKLMSVTKDTKDALTAVFSKMFSKLLSKSNKSEKLEVVKTSTESSADKLIVYPSTAAYDAYNGYESGR